jgi:L-fuculose-phosphate aldolase
MRDAATRQAVVDTARALNARGLNQGTSGNVSARVAGGLLLTPSGMPYEQLTAADVVGMGWDGGWHCPLSPRKPTTEWRIHRDVLAAKPEVGAVVHAHSPWATALSCLDRGIPPFHYMVAVAGGTDIPCAAYATFGTQALSDTALAALDGRRACLLANHGQLALGPSLAKALALAVEVETLAAQYMRALQVAEPTRLSEAEMARVHERMRGYGHA